MAFGAFGFLDFAGYPVGPPGKFAPRGKGGAQVGGYRRLLLAMMYEEYYRSILDHQRFVETVNGVVRMRAEMQQRQWQADVAVERASVDAAVEMVVLSEL